MSTLRSGLEELRAVDVRSLPDGELKDRLGEIARSSGVLEAERARTVAEIERRGAYGADGHLSITSFVEHHLQSSWWEAARTVRVARALEEHPALREALSEGEVSPWAVAELASAREARPEAFSKDEGMLVQAARALPVRELRRAVARWAEGVDAEGASREDRERSERRGLDVSPTAGGMVRLQGLLDPETGGGVMTALRAVTDHWARSLTEDRRTPAQRRCDALGEISRHWLDRSDRPRVGGERPHLSVVMDLGALEGRAGRRCELDDGGRIPPEAARRLACDASVARVITRGESEPLEVGRRTPVVSPALRRAVVIRDGACRFPWCDRPPGWCDAHHVRHWADGGETGIRNLVLLCRRHHRMVHEDGFGLEMVDGHPVFRRPDGSVLEERAPP